jgi:hypothetical protein
MTGSARPSSKVMMIIISGMMAMPQAWALQASRHAVNSAGLMA